MKIEELYEAPGVKFLNLDFESIVCSSITGAVHEPYIDDDEDDNLWR